jgi:hypothetical protein
MQLRKSVPIAILPEYRVTSVTLSATYCHFKKFFQTVELLLLYIEQFGTRA